MRKWFFLSVFFLVAFALIAFLYFATSAFPYEKPAAPQVIGELRAASDVSDVVLQADHIAYFLSELGAYQLHNSPLSSNTPKIEVVADERVFGAEVVSGKVLVQEKSLIELDLRIIASQEEIVNALRSEDVKGYVQQSVTDGKTRIEQAGSYSQLFSKGYLNLYNELTGKSMTGNIVKIFSKG